MASVEFRAVTKRFGENTVVDDLSLVIEDEEFLVLLGPSGCGKSTVLRMVAGLEEPSEGSVLIDSEVMNGVDPRDRDTAMVFQSYALYPHMTVSKNIEAPLLGHRVRDEHGEYRKLSSGERRDMVHGAAEMLGLTDYLDRKPAALSGGQRQRVALARAIVRTPRVFLMDEPLSNLDAKLRAQTRLELVELWHRLQTTIVYVTHDQVEAMTMASRIAVIADGKLQQVGTPSDVYHQPANLMVARFIGSPQMNTFSATLSAGPDGAELRVGGQLVAVVSLPEAARDDVVDGRRVTVGVRADHLQIAEHGTLTGTVRAVEQLGYESHVICDVDGNLVTVRQPESVPVPIVGCPVRLTLDPTRLHLFDPDSGLRL